MNDIGRAISPGGLTEPLSALPIKMKIDDVAKFEQQQQFAFSFAAKIDGLRARWGKMSPILVKILEHGKMWFHTNSDKY